MIPADRPPARPGDRVAKCSARSVRLHREQRTAHDLRSWSVRHGPTQHTGENLTAETAFTVLALARALKAQGKDVVELEIGDSPFPSTPHAKAAGIQAIEENQTGYCPSLGLPDFRDGGRPVRQRPSSAIDATAENVVVASGAKPFEQYFAEALLDPGDGVLIFSPHFPTYVPNLERRGARPVLVPLRRRTVSGPAPRTSRTSWRTTRKPRAIFLNSPHNPTGASPPATTWRRSPTSCGAPT